MIWIWYWTSHEWLAESFGVLCVSDLSASAIFTAVIHIQGVNIGARIWLQVLIIFFNVTKKFKTMIFITSAEPRAASLWPLRVIAALNYRTIFNSFSATTVITKNLAWWIRVGLEVWFHSPLNRVLNGCRVCHINPCPLIFNAFIIRINTSAILTLNRSIEGALLAD